MGRRGEKYGRYVWCSIWASGYIASSPLPPLPSPLCYLTIIHPFPLPTLSLLPSVLPLLINCGQPPPPPPPHPPKIELYRSPLCRMTHCKRDTPTKRPRERRVLQPRDTNTIHAPYRPLAG